MKLIASKYKPLYEIGEILFFDISGEAFKRTIVERMFNLKMQKWRYIVERQDHVKFMVNEDYIKKNYFK